MEGQKNPAPRGVRLSVSNDSEVCADARPRVLSIAVPASLLTEPTPFQAISTANERQTSRERSIAGRARRAQTLEEDVLLWGGLGSTEALHETAERLDSIRASIGGGLDSIRASIGGGRSASVADGVGRSRASTFIAGRQTRPSTLTRVIEEEYEQSRDILHSLPASLQPAQLEPPTGSNTTACLFLIAAAFIGSLMSLASKQVIIWTENDWAFAGLCQYGGGIVITGVLLALTHEPGAPFIKAPRKRHWLATRSVIGGFPFTVIANANLDISTATTLMYTMPLWAAIIVYVLYRRPWRPPDVFMAITSLAGIALVSVIWDVNDGQGSEGGMNPGVGIGASLGFAVSNAFAAVICNTHLRSEDPVFMVTCGMAAGLVFCSFAFIYNFIQYPQDRNDFFQSTAGWYKHAAVASMGFLMVGQQGLRNIGLMKAHDSSVTVFLYFNPVFSFVWGIVLLRESPITAQYVGAGLIIGGVALSTLVKVHFDQKDENAKDLEHDVEMTNNPAMGSEAAVKPLQVIENITMTEKNSV